MSTARGDGSAPIRVEVDAELRPLIGGFLDRRRTELATLREAWGAHDHDALRRAGHQLKGAAGGYGFHALTEMGRALEDRARSEDHAGCAAALDDIADYLSRVEVVYVEEV